MNGNNLSLMMQMYSINAQIEGMKADNARSLADGGFPVYVGTDFEYCASELRSLSQFVTAD